MEVQWVPAELQRVSGLSMRSNGDGRDSRSVVHATTQGHIAFGRYKRAPGELLCDPKKALQAWQMVERERTEHTRVTCKRCAQVLELFSKRDAPVQVDRRLVGEWLRDRVGSHTVYNAKIFVDLPAGIEHRNEKLYAEGRSVSDGITHDSEFGKSIDGYRLAIKLCELLRVEYKTVMGRGTQYDLCVSALLESGVLHVHRRTGT